MIPTPLKTLLVTTLCLNLAFPHSLAHAELKPIGRPASKHLVDRAIRSGVLWFSGANFFNKPHDAFAWLDALDPEFKIPREYLVRDVPFSASYVITVTDPAYDPTQDPRYTDVRPAGPFALLVTHDPVLEDLLAGRYGPDFQSRFAGASGVLVPISSLTAKDALTSVNMGEQVKFNFFEADHHYDDSPVRPGEYYDAPFGALVLRGRFQLAARGALRDFLEAEANALGGGGTAPVSDVGDHRLVPVSSEQLEQLRIALQLHDNRVLSPKIGETFEPASYWALQITADVITAPVIFPVYLVLASLFGAICATNMITGKKCVQ